MLSEADLIAKRAALRWLAKLHPAWTHQDLAEALDMSRPWVSKWLQRLRRADPDDVMALHSRSYARHTPPFSIASQPAVVQRILQIRVEPPENLQRVVFLIDGQQIGEDAEAPFSIQFHTGNYALGVHMLSAAGYTSDGRELHSNEARREFVRADEGGKAALRIAGPIVGVTFGIILLSTLLPILMGRRIGSGIPLGAPRSYGMLGGTICPKCKRSFGIHIWGLNMLAGKLDRCPHCGRWSLVRRVSPEELKAAEAVELEMAGAGAGACWQEGRGTYRIPDRLEAGPEDEGSQGRVHAHQAGRWFS